MKSSITVVFSLLFLVVAGFYIYLMPSGEGESVLETARAMKLLPLEEGDEIKLIEILRPEGDQIILLERYGTDWMLTKPVKDKADLLMVDGLQRGLRLSSKARRLTPEKGWEEYGLEKPALKIGIETRKTGKRRYLYFGDPAAVGDFIFAKWAGEEEYFLLNADLMRAFDRSVYSLREKRIFKVLRKDLTKIRIRAHTAEYEMMKDSLGWVWSEPIALLGEELSKQEVDEILAHVRQLYVKDFLDGDRRAKTELGFSADAGYVRLWGKSEGHSETLYLGSDVPKKDGFYGMRGGQEGYFIVARGNVRSFFEMIETLALRAQVIADRNAA